MKKIIELYDNSEPGLSELLKITDIMIEFKFKSIKLMEQNKVLGPGRAEIEKEKQDLYRLLFGPISIESKRESVRECLELLVKSFQGLPKKPKESRKKAIEYFRSECLSPIREIFEA